MNKLYKSILEDIAIEKKRREDKTMPFTIYFGHGEVLKMLKKYKKKVEKILKEKGTRE